MGAETFFEYGIGPSAEKAFADAVERAQWDHGHSGYSGTLAEKRTMVEIPLPEGADPMEYAEKLIDESDERIDDKWGPAGCIKVEDGKYLFFGWASS